MEAEAQQTKLIAHAFRCLATAKRLVDDGHLAEALPVLELMKPLVDELPSNEAHLVREAQESMEQSVVARLAEKSGDPESAADPVAEKQRAKELLLWIQRAEQTSKKQKGAEQLLAEIQSVAEKVRIYWT